MCLHVAAVGTITKTGAHALSGEALAIQLEAFGFLAVAGFVFLTKQNTSSASKRANRQTGKQASRQAGKQASK